MAEFAMVRSFGIDDGQLDMLRPQECFVLGYELAKVDAALTSPAGWSGMIHADNRDRIDAYAKKLGRAVRFTWMEADRSESWMELTIEPKDA
jgi:hypothetical protein